MTYLINLKAILLYLVIWFTTFDIKAVFWWLISSIWRLSWLNQMIWWVSSSNGYQSSGLVICLTTPGVSTASTIYLVIQFTILDFKPVFWWVVSSLLGSNHFIWWFSSPNQPVHKGISHQEHWYAFRFGDFGQQSCWLPTNVDSVLFAIWWVVLPKLCVNI